MLMTILWIAGIAAIPIVPITLFFLEAILIAKKIERRPSTILAAVADILRTKFFYYLSYVPALFGDVFSLLRRAAHWIRDTFFGFIPKEALEQAIKDLGRACGALLKSPFGLFEGWWAAISTSAIPILSSLFFLVGSVVFAIMLEAILFYYEYQTKPSTLIKVVALFAYNIIYMIFTSPYYLIHVWPLACDICYFLFGWLDRGLVRHAAHNLSNATWELIGSVRGVNDGMAFLETHGMGFVGFVVFVLIGGYIMVRLFRCCLDPIKAWVDAPVNQIYGQGAAAVPRAPVAYERLHDDDPEPVDPRPLGRSTRNRRND